MLLYVIVMLLQHHGRESSHLLLNTLHTTLRTFQDQSSWSPLWHCLLCNDEGPNKWIHHTFCRCYWPCSSWNTNIHTDVKVLTAVVQLWCSSTVTYMEYSKYGPERFPCRPAGGSDRGVCPSVINRRRQLDSVKRTVLLEPCEVPKLFSVKLCIKGTW